MDRRENNDKIDIKRADNSRLLNATIHFLGDLDAESFTSGILTSSTGEIVSWSLNDEGIVTVEGTAVIPSAPIYIATYNENGQFLGVEILNKPGTVTVTGDTAKLMWLNADSFIPRSAAAEIDLQP